MSTLPVLSGRRSPLLLLGLILALESALYLLVFWVHRGALVDDAYISFRYAARWAEGRGWTWNDGIAVEGFSNPLWTLLLGGLDRYAGLAPDRAAPWLGFGFLGGTTVVLFLLARVRALGGFSRLLLVGGCGLDVGLVLWAGSGLETALASFFVAAVLLVAMAGTRRARDGVLLGLCGAALALSRPEGGGWALWLGIWLIWGAWASGPVIGGWLAGMVPAGLYLLFRWSTFGTLVPNTFFAKLEPTFLGVPYALAGLAAWGAGHAVPLALGVWGWSGRRRVRSVATGPRWALILPVGFVGWQLLFVLVAGGDWMGRMRFLAPVLPAFYLIVAEGGRFRAWTGARWRIVAGAVLALHLAVGWGLRDRIPTHTREGRELGLWLQKTAAPGDTVAVTAAGAIPYFSELPAIDVLGINDPRVRQRPPRHTGSWAPGHHRYDLEETLSIEPAWIVWDFGVQVNRYRIRQLSRATGSEDRLDYRRALLADPRFSSRYIIDDTAPAATQRAYTVFRRR